jgi:histidinol-phosphatase (PHP family)
MDMSEPLLYEQHMHTPLCRHAVGEPEEYAAVAQARGLKGIVVTCHNPLPNNLAPEVRMFPEQWNDYVGIIARAREAWAGRIDVRMGLECDFWPGLEGFLEQQLAANEFHHVLGSVHPHMRDYRQRFYKGDILEYQKLYFEHLALAAETGLFDTLSHPDLIKNEDPAQWGARRLLPEIERSLDRIAASGTAMELNTSGANKALPEMNPGPLILHAMRARDIPVVIGADAHTPKRVADRFEDALNLLQSVGYEEVSVTVHRKRHPVPIGAARASLKPIPTSAWEGIVQNARLGLSLAKSKLGALPR